MWNFTEAIHGKGEHDGVGACIKRALACEELKYKDGAILIDTKSIVQWCNTTMVQVSKVSLQFVDFFG